MPSAQGKERDWETGLDYVEARYYRSAAEIPGGRDDPAIGMFQQVDPLWKKYPGWNPYNYTANDPINKSDPDGRFVQALLGAAIGAYSGYKIGEAKGAKGWDMFKYVSGGAIIGGTAGYLGYGIAASGGFFSQTGSIMASSYFNSVGMTMLSGGDVDPIISFGAGSYNFNTGELGYLGKSGNSVMENIGNFLGMMANVRDINGFVNSTESILYAEKKDFINHIAIVDRNNGDILLSWGPGGTKFSKGALKSRIVNAKPFLQELGGYKKFAFAIQKATADYPVYKELSLNIIVNKYLMNTVSSLKNLVPYNGLTFNCSNIASLALWLNGIPNIGLHPYTLYGTVWIYSNGVRLDLFSYYFNMNYNERR